jgi:ABC-2 type transport system ATP-binding protein
MLAIEARGLSKSFAGAFGWGAPKLALDDVTLQVPRGSAFGLIGLNGAGKTTFIKAMLAVLRPSAGALSVLGGDPEDPAIRARVGYLPERLYLPPSWSARAFLGSVGRLRGVPAARLDGEIDRQLARVGLAPADARRKSGGYSKGMRQRLGLAAALLGAPELLILDEPTDGVDPLGRGEIRALLAEERARGATLFLNSHLLSETERICDRIGILHQGRVLLEGTVEALAASDDRWIVRLDPGGTTDPARLAPLIAAPGQAATFTLRGGDVVALNAALDVARAAGALITAVERDTKDLEQILREALA